MLPEHGLSGTPGGQIVFAQLAQDPAGPGQQHMLDLAARDPEGSGYGQSVLGDAHAQRAAVAALQTVADILAIQHQLAVGLRVLQQRFGAGGLCHADAATVAQGVRLA